jgi:HAD superfamily hydrolase (TIGR01509 family)
MVKAVIFDWDGTLWDVLGFMVETYTEVFDHFGLRPWTREEYQEKFRHDWRDMVDEMGLTSHADYLISHWEQKIATERPSAYPWVGGLVERLSKRGLELAVVSSAPRKPLMRELDRNGILGSMKVVVSGDDFEERKPSPIPLLYACSVMAAKPTECVYVGDMVEDIQACRKAGMAVAAVAWGLHSKARLQTENPDFMADSNIQLRNYLLRKASATN